MASTGAAYKLCIDVIILHTTQTNAKADRIQVNSLEWEVVQELVGGGGGKQRGPRKTIKKCPIDL
jgi:hypothetical protein